jgi:arginine-tRNA-protein transferase
MDDGLSAVYTFFDPDEQRRSLGVFAILKQIEYVRTLNLDYLYLGYWVPHSAKMNYKSQYTPLELLLMGNGVDLIAHSQKMKSINSATH